MSFPPKWRGCAAYFSTPRFAAQNLVETVYDNNCRNPPSGCSPLPDIEYRISTREEDNLRHVFRWDLTPFQEVFQNGFHARRQQDTPDNIYFNLEHYVHEVDRPLDSRLDATHAFISTTLSSGWHPSGRGTGIEVYRYEIYAPGGIWVAQTLGARYRYPAQDEVCFVAGIAPQYIRSAQLFRLETDERGNTRRERVDDVIIVNGNFDPLPEDSEAGPIRRPIFDRVDKESKRREPLKIRIVGARANSETDPEDFWYTGSGKVANCESYIDAAFRSSRNNEAYLFMRNEYVRLDYAPGSTGDRVINGPLPICEGYPSLAGTAFGEYGIDCAFGCNNGDEAFIFSLNLCAKINYAPGTLDDKIIKGPMTITAMFPFFKKMVFESGVDAAFESTRENEAYLFKGNRYARINYGPNPHLIGNQFISEGFPCLKSTIFESGIDAALASHRANEAYLFKGDSYTRINFAPGTTNDYIMGGIKMIRPNWPALSCNLPRKNRGIDVHYHNKPEEMEKGHLRRLKVVWRRRCSLPLPRFRPNAVSPALGV